MPLYDTLSTGSKTQPQGVSGLRNYSGYIREDFITDLTGIRGREIFLEMSLNDATVGAVLYSIKNMLRGVEWRVTPSDEDDTQSVEAAELLESILFEDMQVGWADTIANACSMFVYGFAVFEPLWKKRNGKNSKKWLNSKFDDGLWGLDRIASRSQRSIDHWLFDKDEHLTGFVQTPQNGIQRAVSLARCLHFRTTSELDNPEGTSVLRNAYRSWYFLKRIQSIEAVGIERDLTGLPVIKLPGEMLDPNASPEAIAARNSYEAMLRNVRRDSSEGLLLPSDRDDTGNAFFEFELASTGGQRQFDISEIVSRYEKRIAMSVLGDFIFVGADGAGSMALAEVKTETFVRAVEAYQAHMAGVINDQLVPMIWSMNGLDDDLMPKLKPGQILDQDLEKLGDYISNLAGVGYDLATDVELENHLRAAAKLPAAPDRENMVDDLGLPLTTTAENVVSFQPQQPDDDEPDQKPADDEIGKGSGGPKVIDVDAFVREMRLAAGLK